MNKSRLIVAIFLLIFWIRMPVFSQQKHTNPEPRQTPMVLRNTDLFWADASWDTSDAPYIAIRREIDKEIKAGKNIGDIIKEKDQRSLVHPDDPQLAFAWAYVALKNMPYDAYVIDTSSARERTFALIKAIKDKPLSYEYARMQFLTTSIWSPIWTMHTLAKRLLERDPHDDQVKYRAIGMLTQTGAPADEALALQFAEEFLQRYPERFSAHESVGLVHGTMFLYSKDINMGQTAIEELQQSLKFLGNTDIDKKHREDIAFLIQATTQQMEKIKQEQK